MIHMINELGKYSKVTISASNRNERFQYLVKRNTWLAATCSGDPGYSLAGCSLSPGFEFEDFEMANRTELVKAYPESERIITELT